MAGVDYQKLLGVCHQVVANREIRTLITEVLQIIGTLVPADRSTLWVHDQRSGQLITLVGEGLDSIISLPLGQGLVGFAATHSAINITDAYQSPHFDPRWDQKNDYLTRSVVCVPASRNDQIVCVLQCMNRIDNEFGQPLTINGTGRTIRVGSFSETDQWILQTIVDFAGIAVENSELINDLERLVQSTNVAFARAIDARDSTTGEHTRGVVAIALAVASQLGLDPDTTKLVEMAATQHDIGKVGVCKSILCKEGPLNPAERAEMQCHTAITYQILSDIIYPLKYGHVAEYAADHHEFLDGSGYPKGLRDDEIHLVTRIITVADIFHALIQERSYKASRDPHEALAICREMCPAKLDPRVVDALEAVLATCSYQVGSLISQLGW